MIVHLAFTGCMVGLAVFNYRRGGRNVLYPPFLFALIWLVTLIVYMAPPIDVEKVGAYTLAVVVSGVAAFSAGGAIMGRRKYSGSVVGAVANNSISKKVIFFCCLGFLPLSFMEVRRLGGVGNLDSFMMIARTAITDAALNGETVYSNRIYGVAPILAVYCAFIFLIEARDWRRERAWVWGSILTALAFSVLTTGRTWLLELVAGLVGIYLLKSKRLTAGEAWKFARWPLAAFLVLFSVLALVDKDLSGMGGGAAGAIAEGALGYAVVPLAGFDYVLHHAPEYRYEPNHTFRDVLPGLAKVAGVSYAPPPVLDEFVLSLRHPTNVYTVFKFYYVDFGLGGMLISMFLIGAGQTWLFRQALTGDHFYIFLFAVWLFPLMMVAFDDHYSQIRVLVESLALAGLYFRVLRTIPLQARAVCDSGVEANNSA
jgi:oligosaccharide repeat unit polymerase